MIAGSMTNFIKTYVDIGRLVFSKDRRSLMYVLMLYLISFVFLTLALLLLILVIRTLLVSVTNLNPEGLPFFDVPLLGSGTEISFPMIMGSLLLIYVLSAVLLYVAERKWFSIILSIISSLVMELSLQSKGEISKEVRLGSVATIRVSSVILSTLTPAFLALLAFVFLLVINWQLAVLIILLSIFGAYIFTGLGMQTKKISAGISLDDEDTLGDNLRGDVNPRTSNLERLHFIATLMQFKARSRFFANLLFAIMLVGFVAYLSFNLGSFFASYRLLVSAFLLFIIFNGLKVVASKVVPLARQYNLVRDFIELTSG